MDPDTLAPSGALGTSLMLTSGESSEPSGGVSQNPAEVLAQLMDFPGSVAIMELLEGPPSRVPHHALASELGQRLIDDVSARLDALEPMALKPLTGRRAPEPPTAEELWAALARHGLPQNRTSEAVIAALAADLGAAFRAALGTSLRQSQAHVATLRWEIAHDLRVLGPKADRLERLDAAVTRSMQHKMGELLDRMEQAAQATFVRACAHAVEALPEAPTPDDLAGWSAEDGWIGRYHERCVRMAKALFGHLRRGLEGLVRAVAQAEEA